MDGLVPASKGKRFAAGLIDLVIIPIVLGIVIGLVLLAAPDVVRSVVLVLVNIIWLVFRDAVYSPGRAMIKVKIVSLTGEKVTPLQALIRNVLLIIPFVLVVGYIVEIVMLLVKGHRLADTWAKTQVVEA
ncbi:MAG TPA: RDD family protein [Candidatus Omnitrophota bacterium]|nr:RDD family protein [Candidatus Omnitrophota bacterium]HRY84973.1 RDD family protein [Candidatus Omnitrophota bacterium]